MSSEEAKSFMAHMLGLLKGANLNTGSLNIYVNFDQATNISNNSEQPKTETQETSPVPATTHTYTDDMIARAIITLDGYQKPLCEKQLFLGIIKVLRSKCGWCGKWQTCCDRINELPIIKESDLEVKCDYNNLKAPCALKFASVDYKDWNEYEPSAAERDIFRKNKDLAQLFEEELERQIMEPH